MEGIIRSFETVNGKYVLELHFRPQSNMYIVTKYKLIPYGDHVTRRAIVLRRDTVGGYQLKLNAPKDIFPFLVELVHAVAQRLAMLT